MKGKRFRHGRMAAIGAGNFWWLLLVGMTTIFLCAPFFRAIYNLGDEGAFLRGADLMVRGKRLYVDFFEFMPPGSYLLIAAWFRVVGVSLESARTLAVLSIAGIACFTFATCRRASRNALLSALLTIGWVMMSQWRGAQVSQHWFTTFFSMVAAWASLASVEQTEPRSLRWPAIAGVAAGAAVMVMQTCGTWTALAALTAFLNLRQNRRELIAYICAVALAPMCVLAFLATQHSLAAAYEDVFHFALTQYSAIQFVPFGQGASLFDRPIEFVFPLSAVLALLIIVRGGRACLNDRPFRLCATFALAGFAGCFPRPDIVHIGLTAPLAFPLLALCATRLTRPLARSRRYTIGLVTIMLCAPSAMSFVSMARTAIDARTAQTPRGKAAFLFIKDVPELLPKIAAAPSQDRFFFYPYMPMLPFLTAREHVSKYDILVPAYTTPAQYKDACLSAVRHASWAVIDRRFADYGNWKQIYPAMPDVAPQEKIRFEKTLNRAFELAVTQGVFELRRRREGVRDDICDSIAGPGS